MPAEGRWEWMQSLRHYTLACRLRGYSLFWLASLFIAVADPVAAAVLGVVERFVRHLDQVDCVMAELGNHGGAAYGYRTNAIGIATVGQFAAA